DGIRDFHVTGVQTCALPILRTSSSFANLSTTESVKPVMNILMNRMDLKSGMSPTFDSNSFTGMRKRYQRSLRCVLFASVTVTFLTSVMKLLPTVMNGWMSTLYWKYSSDSFKVLSRVDCSASGYWVIAFTNSLLLFEIGELPCGLLMFL